MHTLQEAIERVTIEGKIEERYKARAYCTANGYRIVQDTPRIITTSQIDRSSFRIIAEKLKRA